MKIRTNRGMRFFSYEDSIRISYPHFHDAFSISNTDNKIGQLLEHANNPIDISDLKSFCQRELGASSSEASEVISLLMSHNILLSNWKENRYDRHLLYYSLSGLEPTIAQEKVQKSKVGVIGVGGIGSNVAALLAAGGVGEIYISDDDRVEASNLTRTIMYRESSVGKSKTAELANSITQLNLETRVIELVRPFCQEHLNEFVEHFKNCDLIILSADTPDVYKLASKLNKPLLGAGYIDRVGIVGPLLLPTEIEGFAVKNISQIERTQRLNVTYQAPSYGPLNSIVSSICANEAFKFITSNNVFLHNKRLAINPDNYRVEILLTLPEAEAELKNQEDPFKTISKIYVDRRETDSLNKKILDPIFEKYKNNNYKSLLDIGCGIGTYSRLFSDSIDNILAIDTSPDMLSAFSEIGIPPNVETKCCDIQGVPKNKKFDLVIAALVLDHVQDLDKFVKTIVCLAEKGTTLLLVVPSDVRDSVKIEDGKSLITSYMKEGKITKHRTNSQGELATKIESNKRHLETYLNSFITAGFSLSLFKEQSLQNDSLYDLDHELAYFTFMEFIYNGM
ncbi:ThiF family adenylyltransferase [Pseudomonas protegens]|uniref:ThiF family adenylyltransferase n=1 Tax=Pseudomonas protegens TaxID=380021 RepID=UPI0037F1B75F